MARARKLGYNIKVMPRPKILESFDRLEHHDPNDQAPNDLSLRKYIETYAVSLPAIIRGFPRGNLDIRALEAHYWDRLKEYYKYDDFKAVKIESKEAVEFINTAIKMIEAWFYNGKWTECLVEPNEEALRKALSDRKNNFLARVRQNTQVPNLGRDRRNAGLPPMPDIYEDAASSEDLLAVYRKHAFKFFHSPAVVLNTLTKIETEQKVKVSDIAFTYLINGAKEQARSRLKEWSDIRPKSRGVLNKSGDIMIETPNYIKNEPRNAFKRKLFFMKTCMAAAELIRRTQTKDGRLTLEGFEWVMDLREREMERAKRENRDSNYLPMDFAGGDGEKIPYSQSSILHVNTQELPIALMAVDYLREKNLKR